MTRKAKPLGNNIIMESENNYRERNAKYWKYAEIN